MTKAMTIVSIFALAISSTALAKDAAKDALASGLQEGINFVKVRGGEIQSQGTKFRLNIENVHALPITTGIPGPNGVNITTGERTDKRSFVAAWTANDNPNLKGSVIKKDRTVGIYAIKPDLKHNTVSIIVVDLEGREAQRSVEKSLTTPGGSGSVTEYLCASLTFDFDGKDISSMKPSDIMKAINQWLVPLDKPAVTVQSNGEASREAPANSNSALVDKNINDLTRVYGKSETLPGANGNSIVFFPDANVRVLVDPNGKVIKQL